MFYFSSVPVFFFCFFFFFSFLFWFVLVTVTANKINYPLEAVKTLKGKMYESCCILIKSAVLAGYPKLVVVSVLFIFSRHPSPNQFT